MVKYSVSKAKRKLNYFPNKHDVSKHYSPHMIMHKVNLDYNQHCQFTFREYVQAHNDLNIKNTNAPRSLQTNSVITRAKCTGVPVSTLIIKQVHELAKMDGMLKGLKIKNRANQLILDSSWTEGVEYDKNKNNEPDYSSDNKNNNQTNKNNNNESLTTIKTTTKSSISNVNEELDNNNIANMLDN
jgi:hypothetical protein